MKILFLHGWQSTPGGLKPTYLRNHGHEVLNPHLPDDDFDTAVRIAQAEYDLHKPDVVVGSSRGGTVAMNIDCGDTPVVLLCPAWKRWGTAITVKPNTVILHSRADETVPFSDSKELVRNSGLPSKALIEVGFEHRLADEESLGRMLRAVERAMADRGPDGILAHSRIAGGRVPSGSGVIEGTATLHATGYSPPLPSIVLSTLIIPGDKTKEGLLVKGVSRAWFEILRHIQAAPEDIYRIDCWKWEEIIAGAYRQAGWQIVTLTPKRGDKGVDVIAEGEFGQLRFLCLDQVKAYRPDHLVGPDEIREMKGVLLERPEASKAIVTTTSTFSPGASEEAKKLYPRLELKPHDELLRWLESLAEEEGGGTETS